MADDEEEKVETTEEKETPEEESEVIVAGLDDEEEEEPKEKEEEEEEEAEEPKDKDVQTRIAEALEKATPKDKDEPDDTPRLPEKRVWTEQELSQAEDELDTKLEDEDITQAQWRRASRQIDAIRREQDREALTKDISTTQRRETAERGITAWAKENAPEYLDGRSTECKAATAWAEEIMAPTKNADGSYTIPQGTARVMFGLLHKANTGKKETPKPDAAAIEAKRKEELRGQGNPPGGKKTGKKGDGPAVMAGEESKVFDMLDLPPSALKTYRKIQKGIGNKTLDVEVG
jgi:hypothetical protein